MQWDNHQKLEHEVEMLVVSSETESVGYLQFLKSACLSLQQRVSLPLNVMNTLETASFSTTVGIADSLEAATQLLQALQDLDRNASFGECGGVYSPCGTVILSHNPYFSLRLGLPGRCGAETQPVPRPC